MVFLCPFIDCNRRVKWRVVVHKLGRQINLPQLSSVNNLGIAKIRYYFYHFDKNHKVMQKFFSEVSSFEQKNRRQQIMPAAQNMILHDCINSRGTANAYGD